MKLHSLRRSTTGGGFIYEIRNFPGCAPAGVDTAVSGRTVDRVVVYSIWRGSKLSLPHLRDLHPRRRARRGGAAHRQFGPESERGSKRRRRNLYDPGWDVFANAGFERGLSGRNDFWSATAGLDPQGSRGAHCTRCFSAVNTRPDHRIRVYYADGGRIVEFTVGNSVHLFRGHRIGSWVVCRGAFCERGGRDFCVKPAGGSMRAERPSRFENRLFSVDAVCAVCSYGCRKYGGRHRHTSRPVDDHLDRNCVWNTNVSAALLRRRERPRV